MPTSTPWARPDAPGTDVVTVCAAGCDFATIQLAIDDAGTDAGDVISVADAVHTEQGIDVLKDVTIQGRGAAYTIVQAHERPGEAADRVFHIAEGATVTIQALTIRHGSPTEHTRSGGGILNNGTLIMRYCVVSDNLANCGGGIMNVQGSLTMVDCTVRGNTADGKGPPGFGCGSGGAIKLEDKSEATLENCTLSDNHGEGKGGALHVSCTSKATLANCTVSGNYARGRGGGIHGKGELTLVHCTVAGNSAKGIVRGQGIGEQAGGGLSVRGKGVLRITNTLIADNPDDGDCTLGPDVTFVLNAHNLVEDGTCDPAYTGDPNLGRLFDNGGDTLTHALLPGSLAIDAIPAHACLLSTDQRGMPRPVGDAGTAALCDVGAFER
jgi:predicted outer membrane repeat protein